MAGRLSHRRDFWPEAVRKPLQPAVGRWGFFYLGLGVYRHGGAIQREGKWRVEPRQPSLWMRQNDGIFGLGGIRAVPEDAKSRLRLELSADVVRGKARWDLAFRLPTNRARCVVTVEGGETRQVDTTTMSVGAISHLTFQTERGAAVTISGAVGEPELHGAIIESSEPGGVASQPASTERASPRRSRVNPRPGSSKRGLGNPPVGVRLWHEQWRSVAPPPWTAVESLSLPAPAPRGTVWRGPTDRKARPTSPRVRRSAVERKTAERLGALSSAPPTRWGSEQFEALG
jgi:hypothetical protein